jgi:predicted ABC-type ATPase
MPAPVVVALAGPNGAGKSTAALKLLRGALSVEEFVNADLIAGGISSFHPDRVAMEAGCVMMQRLKSLARLRKDFGFETTLASRSFAPWLRSLVTEGYEFRLAFLWIPSVDMALERVRSRVRTGGHAVPEDTIRRRYRAGLRNFFELYRPLASTWRFYDNSASSGPRLVATGSRNVTLRAHNERLWRQIQVDSGYVG